MASEYASLELIQRRLFIIKYAQNVNDFYVHLDEKIICAAPHPAGGSSMFHPLPKTGVR